MSSLRRLFVRAFGLGFVFAAAVSVSACGEGPKSDGAAAEQDLTAAATPIKVAPPVNEVVTEYLKLFTASVERSRAAHPDVRTLTKDNLEAFTGDETRLETVIDTFFFDRKVTSIPVANVVADVGAFAKAKIIEAAGPDGLVGDTLAEMPRGLSGMFSDARDKLVRAGLVKILKSSPGISIEPMFKEWTRIEGFADVRVRVFQMQGRPTVAGVKRALGFQELAPDAQNAAAVDSFASSLTDAGGKFLDPLTTMWKSPSAKLQVLFSFGEDGIGGIVLAIVDEHGQLFAFQINLEA
jgi:hypothetical protein